MALRLLGTGTGAPAGMVETVGFDPTTPRSQTECASKLRYGQFDQRYPVAQPVSSGP